MSRTARVLSVTVLLMMAVAAIFAAGRKSDDTRPRSAAPPRVGVLAPEIAAADGLAHDGARWYVADGRSHQVHVLDSAAQYLHSFGRKGRGPGEFISPNGVAAGSGKVYVAEPGRPIISVFDSSGIFIRHLQAPDNCSGSVVAMAVSGNVLYALRRCMELPARIRLQVERSTDAKALDIWDVVADTILLAGKSGVPLQFPLFGVNTDRLVIGDGGDACLRVIRLADGIEEASRCLHELPRHIWPAADRERTRASWRGRVVPPDSLPRAIQVALIESGIGVQSLEAVDDVTNWYLLPWLPAPNAKLEPMGKRRVRQSHLASGRLLLAWEHEDGFRFEVIDVAR